MQAAHAFNVQASLSRLDADIRSALDAELFFLTQRERQLFDALLLGDDYWVSRDRICRQIWRGCGAQEYHALQVNKSRVNSKLRSHNAPWRIVQHQDRLRLEHVDPLA